MPTMPWNTLRPPPRRASLTTYIIPAAILTLLTLLSLLGILTHPTPLTTAAASAHAALSELGITSPFHPESTALNITVYRNVSFAPVPLPKGHAKAADVFVRKVRALTRGTTWRSVENVTFEGDLWEPEGMVRLGDDRFVVSAGEYIAPTVKDSVGNYTSVGAGFAHLIVFDGQGKRIADASISKAGSTEYHIGGLDFDGEFIWGTIGEYRPDSSAYVVRASPHDLKPEILGRYQDHLGGIVHDGVKGEITCMTWGGRKAVTFAVVPDGISGGGDGEDMETEKGGDEQQLPAVRVKDNLSYFIDYQDCKFLGRPAGSDKPLMLCSGVTRLSDGYVLGGLALVDIESMQPVVEVPVTLASVKGTRVTMNPMDVAVVEDKLRVYWLPDQHEGVLYVYEADDV